MVIFHSYVAVYQRVTHPQIFIHHFDWTGDWSLAGATDINTKLTPEVSTLNKGAATCGQNRRQYWECSP